MRVIPIAVENNLAALRRNRGYGAASLAGKVGVSRQTIYAIESGTYVPNTAVALRLAQALETTVEELFALTTDTASAKGRPEQALMLPHGDGAQPGQPVQLCRVDERLIALTPSPSPWLLPSSDATLVAMTERGRIARVRPHAMAREAGLEHRVLVAGCDPGISVLARHVRNAGVEVLPAQRNSTQALLLLKKNFVHVAGVHLRDRATGESNLPQIRRMFPGNDVAVVSFASWEEGILTAAENPKQIRGVEDFARRDISIINREAGAGSRLLLDSHLERLKIKRESVRGYEREAAGHLQVAWEVRNGRADCGIATLPVARFCGLHFIPLVSQRYDLAIRRMHLDFPPIAALLDMLNRARFRQEMAVVAGYETATTGQQLL